MEYLAALFGLLIGSFLNVCIARLPWDYSVVEPRSHCGNCARTIEWYDNIPVLSWMLLRARCRYCGVSISWRYPLVEALTGLLFFLVVRDTGWNWAGLKWCLFSAWLVELAFSDLDSRILPDEFTKSGILFGLFLAPVVPLPAGIASMLAGAESPQLASLIDASAGALLLGGGFWAVAAFYHWWRGVEGLGLGDVKLVAMLGMFLGLDAAIFAVALSSVLGLAGGIVWIALLRKDARTYELPYGTFLSAGGLLLMLIQQWTSASGPDGFNGTLPLP
jgi:leader peptidase (prepilin peptidase)/N-methyltransferase